MFNGSFENIVSKGRCLRLSYFNRSHKTKSNGRTTDTTVTGQKLWNTESDSNPKQHRIDRLLYELVILIYNIPYSMPSASSCQINAQLGEIYGKLSWQTTSSRQVKFFEEIYISIYISQDGHSHRICASTEPKSGTSWTCTCWKAVNA